MIGNALDTFSSMPGNGIGSTVVVVPLTGFNYYNRYLDTSVELWYQTSTLNGSIEGGTDGQDMGTVSVYLTAGVWRGTAVAWADNVNGGIINIILDGVTQSIDTYLGANICPFSWEQTISENGLYTLQIINGGKNVGSSRYDMYFANGNIWLTRISDVPPP